MIDLEAREDLHSTDSKRVAPMSRATSVQWQTVRIAQCSRKDVQAKVTR